MNKTLVKKFGSGLLDALIPVILAFSIGAIAILLAGENPLSTYWVLFSRVFLNFKGFLHTLHFAGPLILTGLAIAISFKAGFFNMGVEGQVLVGGFAVAIFAIRFAYLPIGVLIPLCLLIGMIAGILTAMIPGLLKAYFNVNELVVTLLLNYAIFKALEFLTSTVFRDPSASHVSTHMIGANAIIRRLGDTRLTLFFFVALIAFIIMWFVFNRSKLGYEITAIGKN
ncbi:MAG: ABC transporter permease, partial [Acholeplasmataceae bacterium]|nr:ABC transporter permease [Acholeplasmataceae bacterium]